MKNAISAMTGSGMGPPRTVRSKMRRCAGGGGGGVGDTGGRTAGRGARGVRWSRLRRGCWGAAVGRVCAGRLGRRALLWGALVGVLPDLDILLAPLRGGYGEMLYHRGSSHALWFGWAVGPPLGWALWRWRTPHAPELLRSWQRLCVLALVTHPLLDVFTPYGTQLFAPFWRHRFALHSIGIVDPIYTLLLALPSVSPIPIPLPPLHCSTTPPCPFTPIPIPLTLELLPFPYHSPQSHSQSHTTHPRVTPIPIPLTPESLPFPYHSH